MRFNSRHSLINFEMTLHNRSTEIDRPTLEHLEALVSALYSQRGFRHIPFHGWPHVCFVRAKGIEFAGRNGGDISIVSAAALVHDLNYISQSGSEPSAGLELRQDLLSRAGVPPTVAARIEVIIEAAHTANRGPEVSLEAAALSDADTLFKALPVTPIALSSLFRKETGMSISALAEKIVREQLPLLTEGIYFYDAEAELKYGAWARTNVELWTYVASCLEDAAVRLLLRDLNID